MSQVIFRQKLSKIEKDYGLSRLFGFLTNHLLFLINYGTGIIHARSIAIKIFRIVDR